jgi:uncharacterized repeat protein (TIGR03803 family)
MQASDGKLYGVTVWGGSYLYNGVIFSFDPSTSTYTKLKDFVGADGVKPQGTLMQASDGKLMVRRLREEATSRITFWSGNGSYFFL